MQGTFGVLADLDLRVTAHREVTRDVRVALKTGLVADEAASLDVRWDNHRSLDRSAGTQAEACEEGETQRHAGDEGGARAHERWRNWKEPRVGKRDIDPWWARLLGCIGGETAGKPCFGQARRWSNLDLPWSSSPPILNRIMMRQTSLFEDPPAPPVLSARKKRVEAHSRSVARVADAAQFAKALKSFRDFGKETVEILITANLPGGSTISVPGYVNEFWTSAQRAASRLHEYFAFHNAVA